jgi:hypothetical protein
MAKYLVTFSDTINDIEVMGFVMMTDREVENFEELANSITWDFNYKVGEEELSYSSGEDLLSRIEYKEVSNDEFKVLKKLFNADFGVFIGEDDLESIIGEESGEEEEDGDDYRSLDEED